MHTAMVCLHSWSHLIWITSLINGTRISVLTHTIRKHIHVVRFHTREINETNSAISSSSCVFMSVNNQNSSNAWFGKKKTLEHNQRESVKTMSRNVMSWIRGQQDTPSLQYTLVRFSIDDGAGSENGILKLNSFFFQNLSRISLELIFLGTAIKFRKRKKNSSSLVNLLHKTWN